MIYEKIPKSEYKKILDNVPICCVDLIIKNKNNVLVLLRKNEPDKGTWSIPGGRVYKGETLEKAVIRKAYEEAGLKVKIERKIGVYETMFDKGPFNSSVHTINICFLADAIGNNVKIDKTSQDYRWINKIEEYLNPYAKKVLIDSGVFNK